MGLIDTLGPGPTALDTPVFIYFIEEHPDYLPVIAPIFEQANEGLRQVVTSALTLLEVMVVPFRAGDRPLAERYEKLLTRSRGVRLIDLDKSCLRTAAQLHALYPVRTPDALQVATALSRRCSSLVTNDRRLPAFPGLEVLQVKDFLQA